MKKNTQKGLSTSSASGESKSPTSEGLLEQWIALVYSPRISLNSTWSERKDEASKLIDYEPSEEEVRESSKTYFQKNAQAEYYWSLVVMCHNVNQSLREPETSGEKGNENTSYSSKLKNGAALDEIYEIIEKKRREVFKGNEEGLQDFVAEKHSAESGTFLDRRRRNNAK